ncbi:AAA family ATPase [Candidatus Peregrinibacteria bacterium]|jgi:dCMP deaminase|nr:AAA family ATPase [Candidatus Peregrinibacteria bacterium]MBT3598484.1 AAA family ATPase [Candidatus Peregrinibacteria bacterium]MBT7344992.1 AAA family ATPase [Candidatus Peregrinibacteria bacterium]
MYQYVGLTGLMGSGKGEIVKMLQGRGFEYVSLSDMVRAEATSRGLENTRENLQNIGNELRSSGGAGVLGAKVRERILGDSEGKNWVIDGIRNPVECLELRELEDFQMIGVHASDEILITRMLDRNRDGAQVTKEQLEERLKRGKGIGEPPEGQQVSKCLDMADFFVINEGSIEDLHKKVEHFIKLWKGEDRPTFDEIFMEVAYTWAKRATCLRRRVGAVIAKDKQQITAGYNGAPKGVPHCADMGGCLREKMGIPSGQRAEICRGTHAEQNAITQAAKFGISIEGSTLYCNTFPCVICTKMILNAGIETVVYDSDYNDPLSKEILGQQHGLELRRYEGKKVRI